MKHCIPDELFNRIPCPSAAERSETGIDGICREITYKLPGAEDVVVRREVWHSLCDFCGRTGAWLECAEAAATTEESEGQTTTVYVDAVPLVPPGSAKFLRVVGAEQRKEGEDVLSQTKAISVGEREITETVDDESVTVTRTCAAFAANNVLSAKVVFSVRPAFDDITANVTSGDFDPKVPQYLIDRYGECISHGALARLYAMRNDGNMARMHAVAYNNDLNRLAFGLITAGMRKHLLIDVEDWLVNTNGNG